ncbi:hypothetical protein JTB14_007503 [Gonioctena quinquepunctata]|nr:hypothetical protein JTB14_007503 [Gonioctena quinquepunctata]
MIPPHKWGIDKFTGGAKSVSISAFFERVEELRIARNVPKEVLLESGLDLFGDRAYQFYKECRQRVSSWEGLVGEFRHEDLSAIHNEALFEELRRRTQHPFESIGVYLAVMSSYFNRLRCPITEEAKLSIIIRNLHPFYQDRLRDPLPTSVSELRVLCRRMEARRDAIDSYAEPSGRKTNVLEKDLAFVEVSESLDHLEIASTPSNSSTSRQVICFRCNEVGHRAVGCAMPKGIHCFRGKWEPTLLTGRRRGIGIRQSTTNGLQPILDFILDHAENDVRLYLKVDVLGLTLLGLLDSGASKTIIGSRGWELIRSIGLQVDTSKKVHCRVANSQSCQSVGECTVPFRVRDHIRLMKVLVVLEVPHTLILGADFWKVMGIVPDLRHDEWYFS